MNKDKLISLIIRKETYKDTKPYLNDLAAGKESAAKVSAEAVRDILTTDYIIEAKLYAIRYLKDAFEKGNPTFIELVQNSILPILMGIAIDETDDKAVTKYAGSSYTKTEQLGNFKSILSSVFRMAKQCIIKWGQWISDPNRKFKGTVNQLKKKNVNMKFEFKYFREENQRFFRDFCKKNGVNLVSTAEVKSPTKSSSVSAPQKKKDPLIEAVQTSILKIEKARNKQQFAKLQNDFNEVLNNYLENAVDFQDDLVQKWFEQFQQKKAQTLKKLEGKSKVGSSSLGVTPGQDKSKEQSKRTEKNGSIGELDINSNKKIGNSLASPKTEDKKKSKAEEPPKQVTFSDEQKVAMKSPKSSKKQIEIKETPKQLAVLDNKQTHKVKDQKSPKAAQTKGPLIFDDLEEQQYSKPKSQTQKPLQGSSQKYESFGRSRPQALQQKPIRPVGEESRSPKGTEISQSSKRVEESKGLLKSSESKYNKGSRDEMKPPVQKHEKELPKVPVNILQDLSMSKDEERVSFSQQESSFSQQPPNPQKISFPSANFQKKPNLAAIEEQNYSHFTQNKSGSSIPQLRSKITEQKASVANKLLIQNKHLSQKCNHLEKDFQREKESRLLLSRQKQKMEKELIMLRENEEKMIRKLKSSVPIEDYNILKNQLQKQKITQSQLFQENARLKAEHNSLIQQLNQTRNKMGNYSLQDKSKVGGHSRIEEPSQRSMKERGRQSRNILGSQLLKEEIDEDYIKNNTSVSNIHNWLSQVNILLFKRNCLSLSQIFYRDDYLTILSKSNIYTQNAKQFLSLTFTFQFKSLKQVLPQVKYKNCQELDLWTKPLSGDQMLYIQDLVVGLHRNPIKIMKGELKIIEGLMVRFLLPFMYINFLREESFSLEQFQDIFMHKAEFLIKSKIITLSPGIIKEPDDFKRIFKCSELVSGNKVRFCLSEGISDCIFMGQIQLLRNNKALIRILPIPGTQEMTLKARQLLDDLTFLIS